MRLHLAHAGYPIVGDALYGVPVEEVKRSVEAAKARRAATTTQEEREAAARRRILTSPSSSSSSSSDYLGGGGGGGRGAEGDGGEGKLIVDDEKLGFDSRMALHAWNLKTVHPRAGTPLRLAVDMPDDMVGLAAGLGLNVEGVMLGTAAAAAAAAGGGPARGIGEHAKQAKKQARRVRNTGVRGGSRGRRPPGTGGGEAGGGGDGGDGDGE